MQVYVHKGGKQYDPFTVAHLRQYVQKGNFTTTDHACYDGQNWVTIADVPGFAEATQPAATPSRTAPKRDQVVVREKTIEQRPGSPDASNPASKKKKIILWSSIGGIAVLLVTGLSIWLFDGDETSPESNRSSAAPTDAKPAGSIRPRPAQAGEIDLDDPETRKKIALEAIHFLKTQRRDKEGEILVYATNEQTPYTGWVKWTGAMSDGEFRGNWSVTALVQYKDGKQNGLEMSWYENGQKASEMTWKDGKPTATQVVWKPNGEKCPVTNVDENGNGILVHYDEDGTELFRNTLKGGMAVDIQFPE